jgi:endonuclease V-like protein UPF0215 family
MDMNSGPAPKEQEITGLHLRGFSRNIISNAPHIGHGRVNRVVKAWQSTSIIPEPVRMGRKPKVD